MTATSPPREPRASNGISRTSNRRSTVAVVLGALGTLAVPAAIAAAERSSRFSLLDAAWAIPVAAALGLLALVAARSARARAHWTLGRAGGESRARNARALGTLAICVAITAAISVGVFELLVHYEK